MRITHQLSLAQVFGIFSYLKCLATMSSQASASMTLCTAVRHRSWRWTRLKIVHRGGNERARGDTAVYDFNRRIITMAGNVRLNRGGDTLNGGRLVIDLASGVSSVDGRASGSSSVTGQGQSGGRVTGSFSVPEN